MQGQAVPPLEQGRKFMPLLFRVKRFLTRVQTESAHLYIVR